MKKIYLATPVNGRKEKTLNEKLKGALKRIQEMAKYVVEQIDDEVEFSSSFEIPSIRSYLNHPELGYGLTEPIVMGRCVCMVMEADMAGSALRVASWSVSWRWSMVNR